MGEAKRRKQQDVNYGKVYQISTTQELYRHLDKLFKSFSKKWYENLEVTNYKLDEVNKKQSDWMQEQFSYYKTSDIQLLATALISMYTDAGKDYLEATFQHKESLDQTIALKMFMESLIKVLKPWLSEEQQREFDKLSSQLKD